jgi:hypothetical protein
MTLDKILDKLYLGVMDKEDIRLTPEEALTLYAAYAASQVFKIGDRVTWGAKASSFIIDSFGERNGELVAYLDTDTGILIRTGEAFDTFRGTIMFARVRELEEIQ